MKQNILLILFNFITIITFSQTEKDTTISKLHNYRWRIEASVGDSRGIRPFKEGYFSSNSQKVFGLLYLNSIDFGASYTYTKLIDFRAKFGFDKFSSKDPKSLPYEAAQYRMTLEAVMNMNSLFNYQTDYSRFKLLFHAGISFSTLQNVDTNFDNRPTSKDLNGGIVFGFSPMYRITKRTFLFLDFSSYNNYRQHRTWDGNYSDNNNNLFGQMVNGSIGVTFSLGKKLNWNKADYQNLKQSDSVIEKRVGDLETMMNDTDKDGVPDYLDSENNSIAGVAVDSKGVMVDINKNRVPDELEKYFEEKYFNTATSDSQTTVIDSKSTDFIKKSINDGYVSAFFESNSSKPTNLSVDGINYILMYLKNNPLATIDIIGHSDEIGNSSSNEKLAIARANTVKNILLKAGIESSRLNILSNGEDASVDSNSTFARSLVRRVTFKIK